MNLVGPFVLTVGAYPDTDASLDTPRISGEIVAIGTLFGSVNADIVISTKGETLIPSQPILTKTGNTGTAWFYVKPATNKVSDGSAVTTWFSEGVPVDSEITIALTNADAGDSVSVVFMVDD